MADRLSHQNSELDCIAAAERHVEYDPIEP